MRDRVTQLIARYRAQAPLVRGALAGVGVGVVVALSLAMLDLAVVAGSVPSQGLGIAAGLITAFLVWQQGQPQPTDDPESWSSLQDVSPASLQGASPIGTTLIRTYQGTPAAAASEFQRDAAYLAGFGYSPVAQIYAPGSWGCGAFLIALLLCLILVGILIFIYMIIVKPAGTLTVTYSLTAPPSPRATSS